jgi:hypothetical protein
MKDNLTKEEMLNRLRTLKQMQVPCRSNFFYFTDTKRLKAIENCLKDSPYYCIGKGKLFNLYGKEAAHPLKDADKILLISTHVDTVSNITKMSCLQNVKEGLLKGTFDNTVTNAVCVNMMKYQTLPDNVLFTFNGDEETGRCNGAKEVIKHLNRMGIESDRIIPVALDVTYEGYDKENDFTIENMFSDKIDHPLIAFLDEAMGDDGKPFTNYTYVAPGRTCIPTNIPKDCISKENSWYDEGVAYHSMGLPAFSFCIPCGEGDMHSNEGVLIHADTFLRYEQSLTLLADGYTRFLENDRYKDVSLYVEKMPPSHFSSARYQILFDEAEEEDEYAQGTFDFDDAYDSYHSDIADLVDDIFREAESYDGEER